MPDLSIEIRFMCRTNLYWETEVELTPGHKYTVKFMRMFGGDYPYGHTCTCKAFKFGKGKSCKHIKHVIRNQLRCGWGADGGSYNPAKNSNDDFVCPKCGEAAETIRVAV